jgi:hypothetical protein
MSETPKRRWFRFSLKWLLIAVTTIALWLGWNEYQLHQREAVEKYITSQGGVLNLGPPEHPWKRLPITWRLLGAKSVQFIHARGIADEGNREQTRASFPEAEIYFGD